MGRYTTVQVYGDTNPNMRKVAYEQASASAASGGEGKAEKVKAEKVHNPYGSTAGAGSGEFHIYRHARTREMNRLNQLDVDDKERIANEEYNKLIEHNAVHDEQQTEKRRKKRQRDKEAKLRRKVMKANGLFIDGANNDDGKVSSLGSSNHINAISGNVDHNGDFSNNCNASGVNSEEFEYTPKFNHIENRIVLRKDQDDEDKKNGEENCKDTNAEQPTATA